MSAGGRGGKQKDPFGGYIDPSERHPQALGYLGERLSTPSAPGVEVNIPAEEPIKIPTYAEGQYDIPKASRAAPPGGISAISDELKRKKGYKSTLFAGSKGLTPAEANLRRQTLGSGSKLGLA